MQVEANKPWYGFPCRRSCLNRVVSTRLCRHEGVAFNCIPSKHYGVHPIPDGRINGHHGHLSTVYQLEWDGIRLPFHRA